MVWRTWTLTSAVSSMLSLTSLRSSRCIFLFETCRFLGKLFVLFNRLYFVKVSFLSISLSFAATTVVSACLLWRFIQTHESSQLPVIETLFPRRSVTSLLEWSLSTRIDKSWKSYPKKLAKVLKCSYNVFNDACIFISLIAQEASFFVSTA